MRIYTKIKIDIETLETLESESYDYAGPVAQCKGGGGGDTVDYAYNARMAGIAERQQTLAEEYFDFWRTDQKELERMQIQANKELIPQQTELQKAQMESEMNLMGVREGYERSMMEYAQEDLEARKPLARKYYEEAMTGENPEQRAAEARATVSQQIDAGRSTMRREASRMGADVNSARFQRNLKGASHDRAKGVAGAMVAERNAARERNFGRMDSAMTKNLGVGG